MIVETLIDIGKGMLCVLVAVALAYYFNVAIKRLF